MKASLIFLSLWLVSLVYAQSLPVEGSINRVHDPAMMAENGKYYLFGTGPGVSVRCSDDMKLWRLCSAVFFGLPKWVRAEVPAVTDLWAPDIAFYAGKYWLFYSASSFGENQSAIGLASNLTLDPTAEAYKWHDEGLVIKTERGDSWNAIDPNFVVDAEGKPWLVFGSFWDGVGMVGLEPQTLKPLTPQPHPLARRFSPGAIEAPFIIFREGFYYLFVSFDQCCRGVESSYNIRVGRSATITGSYLDKDGIDMLFGGGSLLKSSGERWKGPGHNAIFSQDGQDYLIYHAYDAEEHGISKLRIEAITWQDGWPTLASLQD